MIFFSFFSASSSCFMTTVGMVIKWLCKVEQFVNVAFFLFCSFLCFIKVYYDIMVKRYLNWQTNIQHQRGFIYDNGNWKNIYRFWKRRTLKRLFSVEILLRWEMRNWSGFEAVFGIYFWRVGSRAVN